MTNLSTSYMSYASGDLEWCGPSNLIGTNHEGHCLAKTICLGMPSISKLVRRSTLRSWIVNLLDLSVSWIDYSTAYYIIACFDERIEMHIIRRRTGIGIHVGCSAIDRFDLSQINSRSEFCPPIDNSEVVWWHCPMIKLINSACLASY